jgi:HAMP domain-containing protein
MPARLALSLFCVGCGIFVLGVLALRVWASFNLAQIVQTLLVGLLVCLIYSLFSLFTMEGIVAPLMAETMARLPQRVSLKGIGLSRKLLITCGSLVLIAILFVSSISFIESKKAVETQAREVQHVQLRLAASAQNWGSLIVKGERLDEALERLQLGGGTSAYLVTSRGALLASNPRGSRPVIPAALLSEFAETSFGSFVDKLKGKIFTFHDVGYQDHYLVSEVDRSQFFEPLRKVVWTTSLICVLTLLIGFYLSYILAGSVTKPLGKLGQYARKISEGEISEKATLASGDEMGMLADAFSHMQQNLLVLAEQAKEIASGDFSQEVAFPGPFGESINAMVANLREMTRQNQEAASRIGSSSSEIVAAAQQQASGASQQAASVSETTATMEELSTTARQIAENSNAVTTVAEETLKSAEDGQAFMEESTKGMVLIRNKTEESSEKILNLGQKSQQIGEMRQLRRVKQARVFRWLQGRSGG